MASISTVIPSTGRRGALLVLEGVDRAGKSTQAKKLLSYLQENKHKFLSSQCVVPNNGGTHDGSMHTDTAGDVELWRFPDRTTHIGETINGYLQGAESHELSDAAVHLLFSANRWEKCGLMLEKLKAGTTLIVDRYAYSGVAFTAAKGIVGLDLDWCKAPDIGLPAPDCTFFLNMPVDEAANRGGYGEERYENVNLQREVVKQFEALADSTWHFVDASASQEIVHDRIREIADDVVQGCLDGKKPLRRLWL